MSNEHKFSNLPFHIHKDCKTVWLARDAVAGEVWEARYCYNHDLKYKRLVSSTENEEQS